MEYYSAIKKNTFESILMRWMKLEPIIQSEVSQKEKHQYSISSVQFSSVAQSCPTLCDPMNRSMPGLPVHHQLLEFTQTHEHRVSNAIQPSHPLSAPSPPPPNQHHSFQRNPRADLLQNGLVGSPCSPRTLKSLLQYHSLKASILWCSGFFTVQFSHPYMTTGKTIALTRRPLVGKVYLFIAVLIGHRCSQALRAR